MTTEGHDVVRVASGEMVTIELYQQALTEAGIESKVVGDALGASFGTAIQNSIELWVRQEDVDRAAAAIARMEAGK